MAERQVTSSATQSRARFALEQNRWRYAILASPEDDALKLQYADWLEENGADPRLVRFHRTPLAPHGGEVGTMLHDLLPRRLGVNCYHTPRFDHLEGVKTLLSPEFANYFHGSGPTCLYVTRYGWIVAIAIGIADFKLAARYLFAKHPIQVVRTAEEPHSLFEDRLGGDGIPWRGWQPGSSNFWDGAGRVPRKIFDLIQAPRVVRRGRRLHKLFPSEQAAREGLSDACVAFGLRTAATYTP